MTRKQRKQNRKLKSKIANEQKEKFRGLDKLARELSVLLTKEAIDKQDKTILHKVVLTKDNKKGCYDAYSKIALCSECFYKRGCKKWEYATLILKEEDNGNHK